MALPLRRSERWCLSTIIGVTTDIEGAGTGSTKLPVRLVLALIGLVVLGFGAWFGTAHWAISGTKVVLDAQPFECAGDEVTRYADDAFATEDQAMWRHAIELREGLDCSIRFHVVNEGWRSVNVESIVLPFLGAESALPTATSLGPHGDPAVLPPIDARVDAAFTISGSPLESDDRETFVARLASNADGCVSEGGAIIVPAPAVVVSAWGISRTIQPVASELAFLGTADSSCDE